MRVVAGILVLVLLSGCAYNPVETKFGGGWAGWYFRDSKDNDLELVNLKVDPTTKTFSADKIVIRNNASDAMRANVEQMMAFVEQQRAANEGIKAAFDGLAALTTQLTTALAAMPVPGDPE